MEDNIEIVIKISKEEYNQIKENKFGVFGGHIFQMIRDGRPLPKQKNNDWIPVTERLPENYGVYLVTVKDELRERLHVMVCKYNPTNVVFRWTPFLPDADAPGVIAWKPLPELYKESEE